MGLRNFSAIFVFFILFSCTEPIPVSVRATPHSLTIRTIYFGFLGNKILFFGKVSNPTLSFWEELSVTMFFGKQEGEQPQKEVGVFYSAKLVQKVVVLFSFTTLPQNPIETPYTLASEDTVWFYIIVPWEQGKSLLLQPVYAEITYITR